MSIACQVPGGTQRGVGVNARRDPDLRLVWLFGTGADASEHARMRSSGADVLIQDLEDSTLPPLRPAARAAAAKLYATWRAAGALACVRINPLDDDGEADLAAVMPAAPDIVAYPKAESSFDIARLERTVARLERRHGLPEGATELLPVCETAAGVMEVRAMAAASARVRCALLGAEDLATDLCAERRADGDELDHARRHFLLQCRAARVEPVDAPFTFDALDGAAAEALYARRLGYRCKSAVRATHVAAIRAALAPDPAAVDRAERIVKAFDEGVAAGRDRVLFEGQWLEVPTIAQARRLISRDRRLREAR